MISINMENLRTAKLAALPQRTFSPCQNHVVTVEPRYRGFNTVAIMVDDGPVAIYSAPDSEDTRDIRRNAEQTASMLSQLMLADNMEITITVVIDDDLMVTAVRTKKPEDLLGSIQMELSQKQKERRAK